MSLVPTQLPRPEADYPLVRISVPAKAVAQLKSLKPGSPIRVVLIGKAKEVSTREPDLDGPGYVGELNLEVHKMEIAKQEDAFGDLFDEGGE